MNNAGRPATEPISTLTTTGSQQGVVSASLLSLHGNDRREVDVRTPHPTLCAGGTHSAVVSTFMQSYQSSSNNPETCDSLVGDTTRVTIKEQEYVIADIGMRMLNPREMFRAQAFAKTILSIAALTAEP